MLPLKLHRAKLSKKHGRFLPQSFSKNFYVSLISDLSKIFVLTEENQDRCGLHGFYDFLITCG